MKGLEISRRFFFEWGLPYLRLNFPSLVSRVAAGMVGASQSIGADDELSRDHGWGPMFTIWLTDEDYETTGRTLEKTMNEAAPRTFTEFSLRERNDQSVSIHSISRFFEERTRYTHPPREQGAWVIGEANESHLYFIKHRTVFQDPLEEFTARCQEFSEWPPDVYLERIRFCCFNLWHYGDYNFVERVSKRSDPIAHLTCLGHFVTATMRLCFYLNDDFAPYWKWLAHELRKIDWAEPVWREINALATAEDTGSQVSHVKAISRMLRRKLASRGMISSDDAESTSKFEVIETHERFRRGCV